MKITFLKYELVTYKSELFYWLFTVGKSYKKSTTDDYEKFDAKLS